MAIFQIGRLQCLQNRKYKLAAVGSNFAKPNNSGCSAARAGGENCLITGPGIEIHSAAAGGGGCTAPIYMYSNSLCFDKYDLPLSVFQLLVYWVVHTAGIKLRTFLYPCLQKSCQCERATVFVLAKVLFFSSVSYILGNTGMPCPFYIKTFNKISQESLY